MPRRLEYSPEAARAIGALPPAVKRRLKQALNALRSDPQGTRKTVDAKRLVADADLAVWRLAVGSWRAIYAFDRESIRVLEIFPRSEGYDWLEGTG